MKPHFLLVFWEFSNIFRKIFLEHFFKGSSKTWLNNNFHTKQVYVTRHNKIYIAADYIFREKI